MCNIIEVTENKMKKVLPLLKTKKMTKMYIDELFLN